MWQSSPNLQRQLHLWDRTTQKSGAWQVASTIPQESTKQQRRNNADHLAGYHEIRRKDLSVLLHASTLPISNLLPITQKQNSVFNSSVPLSQLQLLHASFSVIPFCPERQGIWSTRQYSAGLQISKEPEIQIFQWDLATMILTALYTHSSE